MLPFNILENGKTLFAVGVTALVVGLSAWAYHAWAISHLEARQAAALQQQKETLTGECRKDKQITEETSRDLQTQMSDLRGQLDRAKRLRPNRCIPIIAGGPAGHDGTAPDPQLPDPHGVASDDLLDYAYAAEQIGRQLDACQGFIRRVWKERGQI